MASRTQGPSKVSWTAKDVSDLNTIATAEFGSAYNAALQNGYTPPAAENLAYQAAKQVTDVVTNRAAMWGMTPSDVISARGQFEPVSKYGTIEGVEAHFGTDPNVAAMVSQRLGELKAGLPTRDFSYFDNPDAVKAMYDRHEASLDTLARSEWAQSLDPADHLDVNISPTARHNAYSLETDNIPANITQDISPAVHQQFDIPTDLGFYSALNTPVEQAAMHNAQQPDAAPQGAAIDAWGGWNNPAENMGRIDTAAAAVPNFGQNETNYGPSYDGWSNPAESWGRVDAAPTAPNFGMNETNYAAADPYGGWSNPAEGTRSYAVSPDMTGYTTGGMFGTPAEGYGFGQGYGDNYASGTVNGLDTPSESRTAPPAQATPDQWGGWSNPAETVGRVDVAQPAPAPTSDVESAFANAPATVTSEPIGAPAADAESERTGRVDTSAKDEPAPQSSVAETMAAATSDATPSEAVAPSMAAGMVPGGYGAFAALQSPTEFGAVPSMVNTAMPAIGFGPDENAPAPMAPSITGMPEFGPASDWGAAEPAVAEQTAPSITGMPGWSPQAQNWSFPSWNEPTLAEPSVGVDTTPTSSTQGWGGYGSVADTGTFGGMYGPGQIGARGDWSGDVATSGPGLGGALSDSTGATNWAGNWNGVDQTGRNLGWAGSLADSFGNVTNESMARAAVNNQAGGGMGGFYGPSGQSISAETSMFGGPGAPLGTSSTASRGLAGLFGGGSGGGWGGDSGEDDGGGAGGGGGTSGNGHSSMGDASY